MYLGDWRMCFLPESDCDDTKMNHNVRKRTYWHVRRAKIQISLRNRAVLSEASQDAFWIAKTCFIVQTAKIDQTGPMHRLIWVFVGRTCQKVRFLTL